VSGQSFIAVCGVLLVGCTSDAEVGKDWGPLTVVEAPEGGADALATGVLEITDECVRLRMDAAGEDALLLVWPDRWTTWDASERTITFEHPDGVAVEVSDGDEVGVGGGFGRRPTDQLVAGSAEPCEGDDFWWVSGLSADG
jgi:hypothetical protein